MEIKKIIFLLTLTIILIIAIGLFLIKPLITGKAIQQENQYSYTKAICNSSNFCQDHIITCQENKTISSKPITGAVVQHSKDWKDPRDKETINELC